MSRPISSVPKQRAASLSSHLRPSTSMHPAPCSCLTDSFMTPVSLSPPLFVGSPCFAPKSNGNHSNAAQLQATAVRVALSNTLATVREWAPNQSRQREKVE